MRICVSAIWGGVHFGEVIFSIYKSLKETLYKSLKKLYILWSVVVEEGDFISLINIIIIL